jgi:DNA-binding transcriptional ArsR family regulator
MKRVGAALKEALTPGGEREQPSRAGISSMALNEVKVLSYLSFHPCSIKSQLVSALSISMASVDWHVRKLGKCDLISQKQGVGRQVYSPVGMLRDDEIRIFSMLASEFSRSLFAELSRNEGISQEELATSLDVSRQSLGRWLKELQEIGALHSVKDGRRVRYYPSDLIPKGADAYFSRRKAFLDGTIARLTAQGMRPKVIKNDPSEVHMLIGTAGKQTGLRFGLNPYVTALWTDNIL